MATISGLLTGLITVKESNGVIQINNIPASTLEATIYREWSSGRLVNNLFMKSGRTSVTLPSFFAIELAYILETLINRDTRPAHARSFRKILELLYQNTWLKKTREPQKGILNFKRLKDMAWKPLPHQQAFFEMYDKQVPAYNLTGYLLSSPPGTGKTYSGLALSAMLEADLVIVVAPMNSLYKVWDKSIRELVKGNPVPWVSKNNKPLDSTGKYFVFHYESLPQAVELAERLKNSRSRSVVILDESHNFNEIKSMRTELFVTLCKTLNCQHVLWSSGTPIKAIGNEAIPLLRTVDPLFIPETEERFKQVFGVSAKRAVDILAHRLGLLTYKVDKRTVVDIEPTVIDVKVSLKNGYDYTLSAIKREMKAFIVERTAYYQANKRVYDKQYVECLQAFKGTIPASDKRARQEFKLYQTHVAKLRKGFDPVADKEIVAWVNRYENRTILPKLPNKLKHQFRDSKSVVKYVQLKIQGECLGRVLGKKRVQCNLDMVAATDLATLINTSLKKTLIFSSYVEVVKAVTAKVKSEGYMPELVYGETTKSLPSIVSRFETNENVNPLVATFDTLSTAVPLIVANTVVMMNSPFRHYEYDQAVSRCARLGQDSPVFVYMVTLDTGDEPNISTRAKDIMAWSAEQVEAIMGVKVVMDEVSEEVALEAYDVALEHAVGVTPRSSDW